MSNTTQRPNRAFNTEIQATRVHAKLIALLQQAVRDSGIQVSDLAESLGVSEDRAVSVISGEADFSMTAFSRYLAATGMSFSFDLETAPSPRAKRSRRTSRILRNNAIHGTIQGSGFSNYTFRPVVNINSHGASKGIMMFDDLVGSLETIHVTDGWSIKAIVSRPAETDIPADHIAGSYAPGSLGHWISRIDEPKSSAYLEEGMTLAIK